MAEPTDTVRSCAHKIAFDSQAAANGAAAVVQWRHGTKLTPYACRQCGAWHLASDYND